jgi:hypothetical protein
MFGWLWGVHQSLQTRDSDQLVKKNNNFEERENSLGHSLYVVISFILCTT